jgi:4-amino-4-deoxy-L-arabinose transferase-like glycosyltransferase
VTDTGGTLPSGSTAQDGTLKYLLLLVAIFLVVNAWNLKLQTIANPDEPRYAQPARAMIRSAKQGDWHEWMVPVYNTRPRLLKPVLFYWIIAGTGAIGEWTGLGMEAGFRLGPLLMGLFATIGVFFLGRRFYGARGGFIAGVVLATNQYFHDISRLLVVDMTLTGFVVLSCLCCHIAVRRLEREQSAFWPLLGFYLAAGLASMTKGPFLVGLWIVLPLVAYMAWDGKLKLLWRAGLWWGAPLALIIGLWWFVWLEANGYQVWNLIKQENLSRAAGGKDHQHYAPFVFYVLNLGHFIPWVLALPFTIYWSYKHARAAWPWKAAASAAVSGKDITQRGGVGQMNDMLEPNFSSIALSPDARFLTCFLAIPFIALGLIISKRDLYLLPLYPFLALWIGWAWERNFLAVEGSSLSRRWRISMAALAFAAVGLITFEIIARPILERGEDREAFFRTVRERLNGRPVVLLGRSANEAVWYLDRPTEDIDNVRFPALKDAFFGKPGTVLLVLDDPSFMRPELKDAISIESELQRGPDRYYLMVADPTRPPKETLFEPRSKRDPAPKDEGED